MTVFPGSAVREPAGIHRPPPQASPSRNRLVALLDPRPPAGAAAPLHGYRAVAAIAVVVYHVAGYAGMTLGSGTTARMFHNLASFGVATFFALAGYLLYLPFVTAHLRGTGPPDPVRHLRRRFVRIWPAYALALVAFLALGLNPARDPGPDHVVTLFSLTQVYRKAYGVAGLPVAWVLCIALAFSVALPFLDAGIRGLTRVAAGGAAGRAGLGPRQKLEGQLAGLAVLVGIAFVYRWLVAGPSFADPETYPFTVFHLWLCNYLDWFAVGMALAVAVAWRDSGRPLPGVLTSLAGQGWLCWLLAAACYGTLAVVLGGGADAADAGATVRETTSQMFIRFELNALVAALFLLPGVLGTGLDPLNRALRSLVPVYLGTISLGIFVWHKVWLDRVKVGHETGASRYSFWAMLLVVSVLTLVTASLSWHLVERPLRRLGGPSADPDESEPAIWAERW